MSNKIKILIVEDEQMLAEILSDTLSDRDFDVHLAYDGIQALEKIRMESFNVIVSDIMMPNLDGYSLAKKLRTEGYNTPILFLTARSATEDVVKTMFRQKTLDEMRRDFTHNITHELKTPISVAVAATDALRNFSADADVKRRSRYLEIVESQLTQLSTMVEHILSVSVEGREYKYNPSVVYLQDVISQLTQGAGMNGGKKPVFNIDCTEDIKIMADEFHIKNLLATVIDNAVKYSSDPIVDIRVADESGNVTIEIEDNGCGIAKEHLSHVFEKFYRVPTGDIHTVRGYGLGLYYAKQVAELHKGTISMNSRVGKGTIVTIRLPRNEQ